MTNEEFIILAEKVAEGSASISEIALYNASYESFQQDPQSLTADGLDSKELKKESLARFWKNTNHSKPVVKLWPRIAVVAAAVAAIVLGVYFFNYRGEVASVPRNDEVAKVNDIAPGKNGATITLANGRVIELSDAKTGVVVGQEIKYSDGSDVRYSSGSRSSGSLKGSQRSTGPVGVRSLTPSELQGADGKAQILAANTAKGQTYQFTLPDGTKVWLNADSKLEFPSSFADSKTRFVKLSGEGYFEVSKDKSHPFIVSTKNQDVTVLGTHFNISAYQDGATRTTLLEGSVRVNGPEQTGDVIRKSFSEVLKPNQQAVLSGNKLDVINANVEQVIAWKNGKFAFNKQSLQEIMRGIARWYNVEVVYEPGFVSRPFTGSISRFENISTVLRVLELTGTVHFKIEGRRVTVMP